MLSIETIHFPGAPSAYVNRDAAGIQALSGLRRINFFVGANNSGKSRLLRFIAQQRGLLVTYSERQRPKLALAYSELNRAIRELLDRGGYVGVGELQQTLGRRELGRSLPIGADDFIGISEELDSVEANGYQLQLRSGSSPRRNSQDVIRDIKAAIVGFRSQTAQLPASELRLPSNVARLYIPTLRSLRPLNSSGDQIAARYRADYEIDNEVKVLTGQTLYHQCRGLLLGDLESRERIRGYQEFLGEEVFGGEEVALIPRDGQESLYVKLGNRQERPIHELGDGVQSLIINTFPMFAFGPALVFIEEPELFLHPAMQRQLVCRMSTQLDQVWFLATHSNHALDLAVEGMQDDVSVHQFSERLEQRSGQTTAVQTFCVNAVPLDDARSLELIGARPSSILLANCVLWVEGITDRLYIRKLLELSGLLGSRLLEDIHFVFAEYGGSNRAHLSFREDADPREVRVLSIARYSVLIADADSRARNRSFVERMERELGDRFIKLPVREVENLLGPEVIAAVLSEHEGRAIPSAIFRPDEYKDRYLGSYCEEILRTNGGIQRTGGYADDSGTMKSKLDFCGRALRHLTAERLSPPAKELADALEARIVACNPTLR